MAGLGKACCTLPAVTTSNYTPKGKHETFAGLNTYVTSSTSPTRGLVAAYYAFGFHPSTSQGADLLAENLHAVVLMPDFLEGGLPLDVYPPDTEEKKSILMDFMTNRADPPRHTAKLLEVQKEAEEKWPSVKGWGAYGFCWGGKLTALASGPGTPFKAAGTAHPSFIAKEDADKLTIPYICLFSSEDGSPEQMAEYNKALKKGKENEVESYVPMQHGWMAARADFENEESLKEFERVYKQLANFFAKHL